MLNTLTNSHGLARTSSSPGRTQTINFFLINERIYFVDLPGYGFARVSLAQRRAWGELMAGYLAQRQSLVGVLAVMDVRHPFKDSDADLLKLLQEGGFQSHVVLNKADKLTRGDGKGVLLQARRELGADGAQAQLFSSVSGVGVEELRRVVSGWLE